MLDETIPQTIPCTVYVRWSSEAQTGRDSLRRQLEAAHRYAADRGLQIVDTIIDEAVSAFSGDHLTKGGLGQFIRRVQAGELGMPHVLIFESWDRLNRQAPLDALGPFISLINAGLTLVTLTDRQEFTRESMSRDGGLKLLGSLLVMLRAHEESATKSIRVRAAWERKRLTARSIKLTKMCPSWLRLRNDRSGFEVFEDRAKIVRSILTDTAFGIGKAKIAARLNANGVPVFGRGKGWSSSYIQKIVWSDACRGIYQPHTLRQGRREASGDPVADYFPRIADDTLVMRARAAVLARRTGAGGRNGTKFNNIMSGISRCGTCGSGMGYVAKGGRERYLICRAAHRLYRCESRTLFNLDVAERGFLDFVAMLDPAGPWMGGPVPHRELREAEAVVARHSIRFTRLLGAFGTDGTPEVTHEIGKVRDALIGSRAKVAELQEQVLLKTYGAGGLELYESVRALRAVEGDGLVPADLFAMRARVCHAARQTGLVAVFEHAERVIHFSCEDQGMDSRFACVVTRADPARHTSGRFAGRVAQQLEHDG